MFRITTLDAPDGLVMKLEGCLAAPWAAEAYAAWQRLSGIRAGRPVRVDLREVCHVDDEGRKLMTLMHLDGAQFVASGCVMPEVVREIAEAASAGLSFVWRN